MAKPDPTVTVEINCGCGEIFRSEALSNSGKQVVICPAMLTAMQHAYDTGHTIDGFIRIQPN